MVMIEYVGDRQEELAGPLLQLSCVGCQGALSALDAQDAQNFCGVEVSMLSDDLDSELAAGLLDFCAAVKGAGAGLRIVHTDLGSGSDCEQRLFELTNERRVRESEKVFAEKTKRESSKEKDFAAAAAKRRKGDEGIEAAAVRIAAIDSDLADLEKVKLQTPWYLLFTSIQAVNRNAVRQLDLANCGLHATGLAMLTTIMLELETRAEGAKISWLVLDGNELTDIGMGVLASFLRLSRSIEVLQVRNVGITEQGVSELVAGIVTNKSLRLLDIRANGLVETDAARQVISGVQRFNTTAEILLT
jgi:hypothetical protein